MTVAQVTWLSVLVDSGSQMIVSYCLFNYSSQLQWKRCWAMKKVIFIPEQAFTEFRFNSLSMSDRVIFTKHV